MILEINSFSNDVKQHIYPVTHHLRWFSFIKRLVRLALFRFSALSDASFYEWFCFNRLRNALSGRGIFGCGANFDPSRAQKVTDLLIDLGGEIHCIVPSDREALLQVIKLSVSSLKKKIEKLGGFWGKIGDQIVIKQPRHPSSQWKRFYQESLKKIFSEVEINGSMRLVTSTNAEHIPFGKGERKTECVLFSSIGQLFAMKKLEMGTFLGKGIDLIVYHPRGSFGSKGYASIEGLNNDLEAVGRFAQKFYQVNKLCIYGACGESFPGFHLFAKWHAMGVNIIFDNAPISLNRVIGKIHVIAAWFFRLVENEIHAPPTSKCFEQKDDFDSLKKIEQLQKEENGGYVALIKTPGDHLSPPEDIDRMGELLKEKGNRVLVLENDPKKALKKGGNQNPHWANAFRNPDIEAELAKLMLGLI